jgi:Ca2+-binding RTX toxin-like protein
MSYLRFLSAALFLAACVDAPDLEEVESELAASYTAKVKNRVLTITGNNAASTLTLRTGVTASQLQIDVGDDGSAEYTFDRGAFEKIVVDASGGNDVVLVRELGGAFTAEEQVTIQGGAGDDVIQGGVGPETLLGGGGVDTILGGLGIDQINLGAGDDTAIWDPGGASDVLVGGDGLDLLQLRLANAGEQIALTASGDHLRLTRDLGTVTIDGLGDEHVAMATRGGADRVVVGDLTAAGVARVDVDLESAIAGQGDALADAVVLAATPAADVASVWSDGAAVVASLGGAEVRVTGGEPALDRFVIEGDAADRVEVVGTAGADTITAISDAGAVVYDGGAYNTLVAPVAGVPVTVLGLGGNDTITALGGILTPLVFDGGEGEDTLRGGPGADVLLGGLGNDLVDGNQGADVAFLGDGDDTFQWYPGDGSDTVEGGAGADTHAFHGSNIAERLDVRANGARTTLTRDIATISTDLNAVERIAMRVLGGADVITVHTGVDVTVDVDLLGSTGAGDAIADTVVVAGGVTVSGANGAVTAIAGTADVTVRSGEPALDRLSVSGSVDVVGTAGADTIAAFADSSTGTVLVDGGGYGVLVSPVAGSSVRLVGSGGDDWLGVTGGTLFPLILDGGEGADTLIGGAGPDVLFGGAGHDVVDGNMGADVALLGDGDDTFGWDPGDGSDTVEGELGADTLRFSGGNVNEIIDLRANGSRVQLTRNIGTVSADLAGVERLELDARGGGDLVTVWDLTGTALAQVDVNVGLGDAMLDVVAVVGTALDDAIVASVESGRVVVTGLPATVRVSNPDVTDELRLFGAAGADTFAATPDATAAMTVTTFPD